jgi:organic hydroperoxide reductase OsmC/OhrA
MTSDTHRYRVDVEWTGNTGAGTGHYGDYARDHVIRIEGKPVLRGSSDPAFRGDPTRHNPEDLLIASLSSCHMLWYLHLCAEAGLVVERYRDQAVGLLELSGAGGGRFRDVLLQPRVRFRPPVDLTLAKTLHARAHALCFIASSMNFPVRCHPDLALANEPDQER